MSGQDPKFVKGAFAKIADRYVVTNHVLSMGTDILWRRKVGRIVSRWNPEHVLDVATGTGDLALEIQKRCPEAKVLGTDFCPEMLAHATEGGVKETKVEDAMNLSFEDNTFDVVTAAFGLRNMEDWQKALREMGRVIKPGGHLLVLDFSQPSGFLRKPYGLYLNRILPKVAGLLTGQGGAYQYLAGSIGEFPYGEKMIELFKNAEFQDCECRSLSGGIASIYTGLKA
ncbi:MAG: ubiquinone/menaquinone biosynthesis methyltransferase [Akkermansiaceae bacterium]|jgi:demethylmenaquinone methyltransferase/2-methoxy-6-polyprenyl-1,4-benzoquinol methylase|nr:methyltransferase [Verrucomicrobiales bacterium]MCH1499668.1 ubiquinone/menaquinone biosynthesis methyltransferase [Akkermansiaceae bacterium]HCQ78981.1 methyltransferase [Verrucomicrobiales bacterium]|tara:strand:- start:10669 stop:11349 length:681 start_codon:yes stop_codon:yes gene_type:complete